MSAPRTRRRWLEVLRRTTGIDAPDARPALDDADLFASRSRAEGAAVEVDRLAERVAAASTRQRMQLDALVENVARLASSAEGAAAALADIEESLDRIAVVGLNTGLEAARANESNARALNIVADEVRLRVSRALEASVGASTGLEEISRVSTEIGKSLERAQRESAEIGVDASQLKANIHTTITSLGDLEARLRKATGLDPETARWVAAAGDHAKGLIAALTALDAAKGSDASRALAPLLGRVAGLLGDLAPNEQAPSSDPSGS